MKGKNINENMLTLDRYVEMDNEKNNEKEKKIFQGMTRREYTIDDLPPKIRKNPKKYVEEIKKLNLSEEQRKLIELIEEGAKIKIQKGKKREVKTILDPYSPYLLLVLEKSLRRRNEY
jgi:hypothetical protein